MIKITGSSDDLIEIEGDIKDEWTAPWEDDGPKGFIACSDGTILNFKYDQDGIWRFNPVILGTAKFSKVSGVVADDTFDVITLEGVIKWVVLGKEVALPT